MRILRITSEYGDILGIPSMEQYDLDPWNWEDQGPKIWKN